MVVLEEGEYNILIKKKKTCISPNLIYGTWLRNHPIATTTLGRIHPYYYYDNDHIVLHKDRLGISPFYKLILYI